MPLTPEEEQELRDLEYLESLGPSARRRRRLAKVPMDVVVRAVGKAQAMARGENVGPLTLEECIVMRLGFLPGDALPEIPDTPSNENYQSKISDPAAPFCEPVPEPAPTRRPAEIEAPERGDIISAIDKTGSTKPSGKPGGFWGWMR
jgi:hypothetical protein